jgi:hypothetical protein
MAGFAALLLRLLVFVTVASPAPAQVGAISPGREAAETSRRPGVQVECGPIDCRPLPPGCRQVRMGGQWLNDNGLRVVCDRKKY